MPRENRLSPEQDEQARLVRDLLDAFSWRTLPLPVVTPFETMHWHPEIPHVQKWYSNPDYRFGQKEADDAAAIFLNTPANLYFFARRIDYLVNRADPCEYLWISFDGMISNLDFYRLLWDNMSKSELTSAVNWLWYYAQREDDAKILDTLAYITARRDSLPDGAPAPVPGPELERLDRERLSKPQAADADVAPVRATAETARAEIGRDPRIKRHPKVPRPPKGSGKLRQRR